MPVFDPTPFQTRLTQTLLKDRYALHRSLKQLITQAKKSGIEDADFKKNLARFEQRLHQSEAIVAQRKSQPLTFEYPPELPVSQKREDILAAIRDNPVVILAGETGSGKTTQLGKLCLELGRGRYGRIVHTQPRRVAATSVAKRIAEELQQPLGQAVGYQIRFQDFSSDNTLLKVVTDGVLLAEIGQDKWLNRYDTIIIDEAHERSLNIDFLLGFLKQLVSKRRDLKVIITSATIDVERFSAYFRDAPVIEVSGRTWPVEMRYTPLETLVAEGDINSAIESVLVDIDQAEKSAQGELPAKDVLVFLPGEQDIRQASLALKRSQQLDLEVLPLYARLNRKEHEKIFSPNKSQRRRVILATNVAETSLTVPGIGYVIDSGLARISRYSHRAKIQRLPIEKIAKASANQRAGRSGRIARGVCYRLYSEEDFNLREDFTPPEIQRTNLSQVILQMLSLGLGDIEAFDFIQPPEQKLVNDGLRQLMDLGALSESRTLTPIGKAMAKWPLDPKLARMVIAAKDFHCLSELLIIVSALAGQDPRDVPADKKEAAREKHKPFVDNRSDFSGLILLFEEVEKQRQALSQNRFRKYCQERFLSYQRLKDWRDIHRQLTLSAKSENYRLNQEPADYAVIHKALLSGFATQIGFQDERFVFSGTRSRKFRLFPSSGLYKKPPKWVMVADLIETSQLYGHTAARIEPEWVIEVAPQLLKYHYFEPHFSRRQGRVLAFRRTSLYGLVLEEKKRVGYSAIDPSVSHDLFVRQGLVEGQLQSHLPFYQHNKQLRQAIEEMETRSRRRDLLVGDDDIFTFYSGVLPSDIHNLKSLEKWVRQQKNPKILFARESDFLKQSLNNADADFPSSIVHEGVEYALGYQFSPGKTHDGLTVRLPVATLNRVPRFLFEWLVPGLLQEKIEHLLKTLPKQYRRQLVPIPDTVSRLLPNLSATDKPLNEILVKRIKDTLGLQIPPDAFQEDKLEPFYLASFELTDTHGKVLETSRDLGHLIRTYGHQVKAALDKKVNKRPAANSTRWTFGEIERQKQFKQSGTLITAYPALEDTGEGVRQTLADYPAARDEIHRKGLIKLAKLYLPQQLKYVKKQLLSGNELQLRLTAEFNPETMKDDLLNATFNHCFFSDSLPFDQTAFETLLESRRQNLVTVAAGLEKLVITIMDNDYKTRSLYSSLTAGTFDTIRQDVDMQRKSLLYPGFIYQTQADYLKEFPRYFLAMKTRLERVPNQLTKDLKYTTVLQGFETRRRELVDTCPEASMLESLVTFRWMLEEYRVSLFAQQLKTRYPISEKRLEKQWEKVKAEVATTLIT